MQTTEISGPGFDRKPKAYEDHLLRGCSGVRRGEVWWWWWLGVGGGRACASTFHQRNVRNMLTILGYKKYKKKFLAHLDEVQKSLCTTPGVGVHINVKVFLMVYIFQII